MQRSRFDRQSIKREINLLKAFECPVCYDYMTEEILLCSNGHSICQTCQNMIKNKCPTCQETFGNARNYVLEEVAASTKFPCRNEGCNQKFDSNTIKDHLRKCQFYVFFCPFSPGGCTWIGINQDLRQHIKDDHDDCIEDWKVCKSVQVNVMFDYGAVFVVYNRKTKEKEEYAAVYIGEKKAENYLLTVTFKDQTGRGYKLIGSSPCISTRVLDGIFKGDMIEFCKTMINERFRNENDRVIVVPSISQNL